MGPNQSALDDYLAEHFPLVHAEIQSMDFDQVRGRLNELTHICVAQYDDIEDGSAQYLRALKGAPQGCACKPNCEAACKGQCEPWA